MDFIENFPWPEAATPNALLKVADIGCRTFFLAPALEAIFRRRGFLPEIHGIEVDAFRRLADFRTRKEYGDYFASLIPSGEFHAIDFLEWNEEVDVAFLLNPFVQERSVLAWGLPLRFLQPGALFAHCAHTLKENGLLLVSAPTVEEKEKSDHWARQAGFLPIKTAEWHPTPRSTQTRPRLGTLYRKTGRQ